MGALSVRWEEGPSLTSSSFLQTSQVWGSQSDSVPAWGSEGSGGPRGMEGTLTVLCLDCCNIIAVHVIPLLPLYLESSLWKVGDVVAVKIEEHQSLSTREGLGVDGFDGISFQVDTLNLWNWSQSIGLQVCDTILTFKQLEHWSLQEMFSECSQC